jgi:hypothetical protein
VERASHIQESAGSEDPTGGIDQNKFAEIVVWIVPKILDVCPPLTR